MTDKERYATIGTWVNVFREEGASIGETVIRERLKDTAVIGITGREKRGRLLEKSFFAESIVRERCRDLLKPPQADADGFIVIRRVRYSTIKNFSQCLGLADHVISRRIVKHSLPSIEGRGRNGRIYNFYLEADVHSICTDFLADLPKANSEGFIVLDGRRYGSILSLAHRLDVARVTIKRQIEDISPDSLQGRDRAGRMCIFYLESELLAARQNNLDLPHANSEGFIILDGKRYGTIRALARCFCVSQRPIRSRIEKYFPAFIQGRAVNGSAFNFYLESDMRELCADLITKKSKK